MVNPLGISLSYLKQHESTSTGFIFAILCFSNVTIFSGGRVGYNRARFVSLFAHVCDPTGPSVSIMLILYIHPVLLLQTLCVTLLFARYFNFVILKPLWTRSLIVLKVTVFFDIIKLLSRVGLFFVFFFCCILIRCGRNFIFCWLGRVGLCHCVVSKKRITLLALSILRIKQKMLQILHIIILSDFSNISYIFSWKCSRFITQHHSSRSVPFYFYTLWSVCWTQNRSIQRITLLESCPMDQIGSMWHTLKWFLYWFYIDYNGRLLPFWSL